MVIGPGRFGVTGSQFGDIVNEIAAGGGLGLAPSADGDPTRAVFRPSRGTAPDIAGRRVATPVGTSLSAALLLRSLCAAPCKAAAGDMRRAVAAMLAEGPRTGDLGGTATTQAAVDAVEAAL